MCTYFTGVYSFLKRNSFSPRCRGYWPGHVEDPTYPSSSSMTPKKMIIHSFMTLYALLTSRMCDVHLLLLFHGFFLHRLLHALAFHCHAESAFFELLKQLKVSFNFIRLSQ